ncbi:MAG: hypothetical protein O7J95_01065 [Planctomycetota bacterium]|nr:hypothetical protein [Planctomycetota bacterium]
MAKSKKKKPNRSSPASADVSDRSVDVSDEWAAFLAQREALLSRSEEEWVTEEFACWKLLQVLNKVQALGGETFLGKDSDSGEDSTSGDDHDGTAFDDIREPEEPVRQPPSLLDERCHT